jgi:hypothetical protein
MKQKQGLGQTKFAISQRIFQFSSVVTGFFCRNASGLSTPISAKLLPVILQKKEAAYALRPCLICRDRRQNFYFA